MSPKDFYSWMILDISHHFFFFVCVGGGGGPHGNGHISKNKPLHTESITLLPLHLFPDPSPGPTILTSWLLGEDVTPQDH
jgi:hypothetical protein